MKTASIIVAALAVTLGGVSKQASAGVQFAPGVHLEVATLFENVITGNGQTLSGYGEVSSINGKNSFEFGGGGFCQTGCELTYAFGGFVSKDFNAATGVVNFTGGWVNFYVGFGADNDFDASLNSAANRTEATNGTLWLTLAGHLNQNAAGQMAVIFGEGDNLGTGNDVGSGDGLLDVDVTGLLNGNTAGPGAVANKNFDTDTQPDNTGGFADFTLDSSFGSITLPAGLAAECRVAATDPANTCLAGSATIRGSAIPEPASLGLLAAGLIGFRLIGRRRTAR